MHWKPANILFIALLTLAGCDKPTPNTGTDDAGYSANINVSNVRSHIEFLADDLLEGRETGTRGYQIAANYVATQFKLFGLTPAGVGDDFFQPVPFRTSQAIQEAAKATILTDQGNIELTP